MMYPFALQLNGIKHRALAHFYADRAAAEWCVDRIEVYDEDDTVELPPGSEPFQRAMARLAELGHDVETAWRATRSEQEREYDPPEPE
jgi:hypothetical protein